MFRSWAKPCIILLLIGAVASSARAAEDIIVFSDRFTSLDQWVVEQRPGGRVETREGVLVIRDIDGCTVWFRPKLKAPVSIHYDAVVCSDARVSDLNCFWMASDPTQPDDLFHPAHPRTGAFIEYDALRTYYVGYGGNSNSTTRFRRYLGDGTKPLLPEHDLKGKGILLEPDRIYHLELVAEDGVAKFIRDGEVLFTFRDPHPLTEGWFGLRTVNAHIEIRNFRITGQSPASSVTVR